MLRRLIEYVNENPEVVHDLFQSYQAGEDKLILGSELWDNLVIFCEQKDRNDLLDSSLALALKKAQEAIATQSWFYFNIRPQVAKWYYLRYHFETQSFEEISVADFLCFKEGLVTGKENDPILEIDLAPFERTFPKMNQARSIGHGVEFLNRRFSSRLAMDLTRGDELLLSFLRVHGYANEPFMINGSLA